MSETQRCHFTLQALSHERLLMRLIQVFDRQRLQPHRVFFQAENDACSVSISVICDPALARRIQAKLYTLHDVSHVELLY